MATAKNPNQPDLEELTKRLEELEKAQAAAHPAAVQPANKPLKETPWREADQAVQAIDTAKAPDLGADLRVDLIVDAIEAVTGLEPRPENQLRFRRVDAQLRKELFQMFPDESAKAAKKVNDRKG